jgi:Methyltransferase domain
MLEASARRILAAVGEQDLILDVGAWAHPFPRADWVLDLLPYESRGIYHYDRDLADERFTAQTWVQRDVCDRDPWPWPDDHFDFAICSHTLEDLRDPVWVCQELSRVARAGYVEVPSRLEEQSLGVHGPWAGWSHHHWLCDVVDGRLEVVFKPPLVHMRESDHFPPEFHATLTPEQRVHQIWWAGRIECVERVYVDAAELDAYLADFVAANAGEAEPRRLQRLLRRD